MKKTPLLFLFAILFFGHGHAQKLFNKIEKADGPFVKMYLAGDIKAEELFSVKEGETADSLVKYTFSAIEWSAVMNCQPCLEEFVSGRKKLEAYLDVKDELDKCIAHAVRNDNMQMLDFLVKNKCDIDHECSSCHGQAPIQVALTYNNYKMFFKLLSLGANANVQNFQKQNLLHTLTASYNDTKTHSGIPGINAIKSIDIAKMIIDTLVKRKVNINAKNKLGDTPLIYAAGTNQPELYTYLKSKGAIVNTSDKKEMVTLLSFAMYYRSEDGSPTTYANMFDKILKEENITLTQELATLDDYDGSYMLISAARADNEKILKVILEFENDVNVTDLESMRAIDWAVENGNPSICTILLNKNAEVDENLIKRAKKIFKGNKELIRKFEKAPKLGQK